MNYQTKLESFGEIIKIVRNIGRTFMDLHNILQSRINMNNSLDSEGFLQDLNHYALVAHVLETPLGTKESERISNDLAQLTLHLEEYPLDISVDIYLNRIGKNYQDIEYLYNRILMHYIIQLDTAQAYSSLVSDKHSELRHALTDFIAYAISKSSDSHDRMTAFLESSHERNAQEIPLDLTDTDGIIAWQELIVQILKEELERTMLSKRKANKLLIRKKISDVCAIYKEKTLPELEKEIEDLRKEGILDNDSRVSTLHQEIIVENRNSE